MTMPQQPRKLRRVTQACDFCHKRSIKCSPSQEDTTRCQNCVDFALQCTYDRPTKRRGVRRKSVTGNGQVASPTSTYIGGPSHHRTHEPSGGPGVSPIYSQETDDDISTTGSRWTARMVASPFIVQGLVDIYFEVVYPMYVLKSSRSNASSSCLVSCFLRSQHVWTRSHITPAKSINHPKSPPQSFHHEFHI
jgi:hypothetical protein